MICKLREAIKEKRRGQLYKGVVLHHNVSSHICAITKTAIAGFELVKHPPYSPDLVTIGCFQNKKNLCGKRFSSDDYVVCAMNQ